MRIPKNIILPLLIFGISIQHTNAIISKYEDKNDPIVYANAKFDITTENGIIYAEDFSHQMINSEAKTKIPLKLDIYSPKNAVRNRPEKTQPLSPLCQIAMKIFIDFQRILTRKR